jgi:predicted ATP-grasp superfamily ATP-dependent carboligase
VVLGGTYNALSAARSVGARGVRTYVLPDGRGTPAVRYSRFVHHWQASDEGGDPTPGWLRWLATGPRGAVVLPAGDEGLEMVATHRAELVVLGYRPVEANDDVVRGMLDKEHSAELAASVGVATPVTRRVGSRAEAVATAAELGYPCAIKPRHSHRVSQALGGHSAIKGAVVDDRMALERAYERLAASGADLTVTQFVVGPDDSYCSYYSYLDDDGQPLAHFTKRKLRQFPCSFGLGSYHMTAWEPEAAALGLQLFQGIGVRGLANVEFKRDARDGRLKLIEANLRLTAADDLVRRAGVDFAWLAYTRAVGDTSQRPQPLPSAPHFRTGLYQWLPSRDFRALRQANGLSRAVWMWTRTLLGNPHTPIFRPDDIGPSISHAGYLTRRLFSMARDGHHGAGAARPSPAVETSDGPQS